MESCHAHSGFESRVRRLEDDGLRLASKLGDIAETTRDHTARIAATESAMKDLAIEVTNTSKTIERWRGVGMAGIAIASAVGSLVGLATSLLVRLLGG